MEYRSVIVNLVLILVDDSAAVCYDWFYWEVNKVGTKEKLLAFFKENQGAYFWGEEIAETSSACQT